MAKLLRHSISIVACAIMIFASFAIAQNATTGKLSGTVTDPTGATIPNANVKLANQATGTVREVKTTDTGLYEFPLLPPGSYRIEVSHSGFKTSVLNNIVVNVTESEALPIRLEIGATNESVTVTGQPELLQTESAAMGQVVSEQQVSELPLVTRNFIQILGFSAGVDMPVTNAADLGRGSGGNVNTRVEMSAEKIVHGARADDNNFEMNGVPVNDDFGSGDAASYAISGGLPIPNPDALAEFKVQTTQYDASYGHNSGGQINIVTKSGSNQFHGDLYEFFRNEDMNANDYFRNLAGKPRGLAAAEPIWRHHWRPVRAEQALLFRVLPGNETVQRHFRFLRSYKLRGAADKRSLGHCAWSIVRGTVGGVRRRRTGGRWIEH